MDKNKKYYIIIAAVVIGLIGVIIAARAPGSNGGHSDNSSINNGNSSDSGTNLGNDPIDTGSIGESGVSGDQPDDSNTANDADGEASISDVIDIFNERILDLPKVVSGEDGLVAPVKMKDTSEILEEAIVYSELNTDGRINRLQLAKVVYNILLEINATPPMYNYMLGYSDVNQIPEDYVYPVSVVSYIGIFRGIDFEPYKVVTVDELSNIFDRLVAYIESYTRVEVKEDAGYTDGILSAAEIVLNGRVLDDKLNGESVAIYSTPTNMGQVDANLNAILPLEFFEGLIKPTQFVDYINITEGIVGLDSLDQLKFTELKNIVGMTLAEPTVFNVDNSLLLNSVLLRNDLLMHQNVLDNSCLGFVMSRDVIAFRDNSVVGIGEVITDASLVKGVALSFSSNLMPLDAVGIIVTRGVLEGTSNTDLVIVKIPINDIGA